MAISNATLTDVPALAALVNSAYRGENSRRGWTTEANMIDGQRIDEATLIDYLTDDHTYILKYTDTDGYLTGCVYLQKQGDKLYLGMLSVSPLLQAKGIGRQLLQAGEQHAKKLNCTSVFMTVIDSRLELISWYERRGYQKTGEIIPLIIPEKYGVLKQPLNMLVLQKNVAD
ncbi:GNAT family N-acetyltransferase [Mucilaginibacter segetis]|uniref:GNAT family N-acetyltransferase n=1 Tax=Mucilaginibacter segetis TaxID=2793071 RepID=A0A934ULP9_9SPHI|nr:GNAT family N-acetyltransferase [Mucilaginibacter segetis]MBK0378594.1 GNAT family N-acetyltransferase [Mucilaginibacter segetis]